jgi:hypothetical protein
VSDATEAASKPRQAPAGQPQHDPCTAIGRSPDGAPAVDASTPEGEERLLWALTAEHAALQNARGSTIFETNGRMAQYLSTVSGALIALGFVGQVSRMGEAFYAFSFTLLPALCLLGLLTYLRCVDSAAEDLYYARAIGRIRQYYRQLDPAADRYLLLSGHDDPPGVLANMGLVPTRWHLLSHSATMVLAVVAILAGAFAALLATVWAGLPVAPTAVAGAAVAGGVAIALLRHESRRWRAAEAAVVPASPSPMSSPQGRAHRGRRLRGGQSS